MNNDSKILPAESFPQDLTKVGDDQLQILNSRVHRQLDAEYLVLDLDPETAGRLEELTTELNRREGHTGPATEITNELP